MLKSILTSLALLTCLWGSAQTAVAQRVQSVQTELEQVEINLSPNLSSGAFVLTREVSLQQARVRVLDGSGRLVDAYVWEEGEPELEAYLKGHPSGTYMIEVTEGRSRWMGRLVLSS